MSPDPKQHEALRVHGEARNTIFISEMAYNGILETLRISVSTEPNEKLLKELPAYFEVCARE